MVLYNLVKVGSTQVGKQQSDIGAPSFSSLFDAETNCGQFALRAPGTWIDGVGSKLNQESGSCLLEAKTLLDELLNRR